MENEKPIGNLKWLKQSLILSAILNLVFLGIFFYFVIKNDPFPFEFDYPLTSSKKTTTWNNAEILNSYSTCSYEKLIEQLKNKNRVEDGYLVRDLALAFLVQKYHFDIKRALRDFPIESKSVLVLEEELLLFPGLSDSAYNSIWGFLAKEKWPFTSEGLFKNLGKYGYEKEPNLAYAFLQTPEFQLVENLFQQPTVPIKKRWLLQLVLEGPFDHLSTLLETQKKGLQLSPETRTSFLISYLKKGSKTAGSLLLLTDWDFALHQLDDATLIQLLDLLPKNGKKGSVFAKLLLTLPRSDAIHKKARSLILVEEKKEITQIRPPRVSTREQLRPKFRDKPPVNAKLKTQKAK